jgi:hypothetical protein
MTLVIHSNMSAREDSEIAAPGHLRTVEKILERRAIDRKNFVRQS